ncbi:unnamed protein product, partial [Oikopleura dioica]
RASFQMYIPSSEAPPRGSWQSLNAQTTATVAPVETTAFAVPSIPAQRTPTVRQSISTAPTAETSNFGDFYA